MQTTANQGRDRLATAAYIFVILGVSGYAAQTIKEFFHGASMGITGKGPNMKTSASTNAEAAHVVLTNLDHVRVSYCFKSVVIKKGSSDKVESVPVCTGEMAPRSTVHVEAPYPIGKIMELCAGEEDRFGRKSLDWTLC